MREWTLVLCGGDDETVAHVRSESPPPFFSLPVRPVVIDVSPQELDATPPETRQFKLNRYFTIPEARGYAYYTETT